MSRRSKKVMWFLQIEGITQNDHGVFIPRMVDWTAKLSYPARLHQIDAEIKEKAAAEGLTKWSLVYLHCLGR